MEWILCLAISGRFNIVINFITELFCRFIDFRSSIKGPQAPRSAAGRDNFAESRA